MGAGMVVAHGPSGREVAVAGGARCAISNGSDRRGRVLSEQARSTNVPIQPVESPRPVASQWLVAIPQPLQIRRNLVHPAEGPRTDPTSRCDW